MSLPALNDLVIWKEIPQDWKRVRLKFVARFAYGDSLPSDHREEGGFPVYGSNGIVGYHNFTNTLSPAIIVGRKGSFGKVTYSESPSFAIDTTYFIDSRYSRQSLRWLYYALHTLELDKNSQDTGVPGLSREKAYEYYLGLPPHNVQKAIASFLDRKTAAIATLITKKQRLIQLLEEKRAALINQAVTKGLNPNVPMKDSGIPWIGEIPKHWKVTKLKRVCQKITDGEHISPELSEDGTPLLSAKDIGDRHINYEVDKFISSENASRFKRRCDPGKGDVLMVSRGATIGRVAIVESDQAFCLMGSVILLKPLASICPIFLYFLLNHTSVNEELLLTSGSSAQQAIYLIDVAELPIQLPFIDEQLQIANYLNKFDRQFKSTLGKIYKQIERLQEYRQSLITAAVTGKLDVMQYKM